MSEMIKAEAYCERVFDGTHDTPKPQESGYKLITSKNIKEYKLDIESAYFISQEDYDAINNRSKVSQYDILFSMIGTVGTLYIERADKVEYAIKNIGVFSCLNQKRADYLYYFLQSPFAKNHISRYLNGAVQKFLPLKALREFPVPIFEEEKYQLIKVLLDIDQKIALNNQINQELEAMAKTLYDYWIVQFDFPNENGKPYKTSGGKMVYNDQLKREIPEGWGVEEIGNLLDKVPNVPKITREDYKVMGKIPIIDQSQSYICGFTDDEQAIIQADLGHIIFGDHTRVVKLINFDYARGADGTQVISSNNDRVPNLLLYQMIKEIDLSNYGYARHFKFLKEKCVLIPNKDISDKYMKQSQRIYDKVKQNIFENQELTQLRDWLLPMLMNGQVRVDKI